MSDSDLGPNGLHHEIYLSDLTETDPAKMHTILRSPFGGGGRVGRDALPVAARYN